MNLYKALTVKIMVNAYCTYTYVKNKSNYQKFQNISNFISSSVQALGRTIMNIFVEHLNSIYMLWFPYLIYFTD